MATYTSNINLEKPAGGALNWGASLNANLDILDTLIESGGVSITDAQYGGDPTAAVDSTAALADALAAANSKQSVLIMRPGVYLIDPATLNPASNNIPVGIYAPGVTLRANAGSSGTFFLLENPHEVFLGFFMYGITFDANGLCDEAFQLHGSQECEYRRLRAIKSTDIGFRLQGQVSYGIYSNHFVQCYSGATDDWAGTNGGDGWDIKTPQGGGTTGNYVAANTFDTCLGQRNLGCGWDIDWANNTYNNCRAEMNDLYGFQLNNTYDSVFLGGYSEKNHQLYATQGDGTAGDATDDESFYLTGGAPVASTGVKIIGGRHIGLISGTLTGTGNLLLPTNALNSVAIHSGGIGLDGAAPVVNGIAGKAGVNLPIQIGSYEIFRVDATNLCLTFSRAPSYLSTQSTSAAGVLDLSGLDHETTYITLTENITSITMPTAFSGRRLTIHFKQAAAGGPYTVAGWPAAVKLPGGSFTMTATASKVDVVILQYNGTFTNWLPVSIQQNC